MQIPEVGTLTDAEIPDAAKNNSAHKPATRLADIQISSTGSSSKVSATDQPETKSEPSKSGSVDIRMLFDKGLISRAEYEKISGLSRENNNDNQS